MHLKQIDIPMRFLSSTRDALAELDLLKPVVKNLGEQDKLHVLDTADHSDKVLKKTRTSDEDVSSRWLASRAYCSKSVRHYFLFGAGLDLPSLAMTFSTS